MLPNPNRFSGSCTPPRTAANLIVPITSAEANKAIRNGYNGTASGSISSTFNLSCEALIEYLGCKGCNGTISHDGDDTFYACPTSDHSGWNLYSQTLPGEPLCIPVWLVADSCHERCPPPSPPRAPVKTSTITAPCPRRRPAVVCWRDVLSRVPLPDARPAFFNAFEVECVPAEFHGLVGDRVDSDFLYRQPY